MLSTKASDVSLSAGFYSFCVDGSSVKSDESLIFKKLKDLNTIHRVIMTGVRPMSYRIDPTLTSTLDTFEQQHQRVV